MTSHCGKSETRKRRGPSFLVNPYEVAFRGFSGTELENIASAVAGELPGVVSIVTKQTAPVSETYVRDQTALDADVALVECDGDLGIPFIAHSSVALTGESVPLARVGHGGAGVGGMECPHLSGDDLAPLVRIVSERFDAVTRATPLYGLVLTGGKSTRMNRDKASISYYDKPQVEHCCELLNGFCEKVYISNRTEQAGEPAQQVAPHIHDVFLEMGPIGGILSALKAHPQAAWLVLACDLPYVDESALRVLVDGRNPFKLATAYVSESDGAPEPLCAIYEPKSLFRLLHFVGLGYHCPRKVLIHSDTRLLKQPMARVMTNVNSPDEYAEALAALAKERRD